MKTPLLVLMVCLSMNTAITAQTTDLYDSTRSLTNDTLMRPGIQWQTAGAGKLRVSQLLIPATLITYGITTINNHTLKGVNKEMQEELWIENSHKQVHLDNYLQWAPAAAVYGLNAMGIKGAHDFRDRTIIYGLSTAIMASTVFAGKNISKQWRPDGADQHSFPSGHTATAFAAAEFLRREYKDVSPWYGIAGYAAAAATGYLRMYNNKHWLSDVVAGAGVGILSTNLAYYLYPTVKRVLVKEKKHPTIVLPYYQSGSVGLSLVHPF